MKNDHKIKVILDRRDFDIGANFKEKEKQILNSDLIVTFFTPEYKKKVDTPKVESGCYREFELINKKRDMDERFLYPILFKGNKEYSVPRDLTNIIYNLNVSSIKYTISDKNYITIEPHPRTKFNNLVNDIIQKTKVNYLLSDIRYIDLTEKYRLLLKNTAADGTLKKSCMIKMPAYKAILEQSSFFVIGRKGSGKSTLLETIEKLEPDVFMNRYKTLCPIKAEYQNVFYNLKDVLNHFKGLNNILSVSDFFKFIADVRFDASFSYDCNDTKNKILILYQLGVIGIRFEEDSISKRGYTHHICFNFNEGLSPIYDTIMDRDTIEQNLEIIINPLFCKMFNIRIKTPELIGNYSWEYIQQLTIEKLSKRRF